MTAQTTLQKTPLNETHASHGAKLVPFCGWEMPLQFGKVLEEHHAVRQASGLFDICHMGILSFRAEQVEDTRQALNYLIPQDLEKVTPGKAVYTQLLNEQGGIIDDIIVYWMPTNEHFPELSQFMVICNAANADAVQAHCRQHVPSHVEMVYLNAKYSLFALQGPQFKQILANVGLPADATLPKRFHIGEYYLGATPVLLSRTGYTGEDGVEILVANADTVALWERLLETGAAPIGLAARDTLRLEAAYPLHGAELSETISPLEAGLGWSVKLKQVQDFIGKAALLQQQQQGLTRHFVCFQMEGRAIPRHDHRLFLQGEAKGIVTSGSISPTLGVPIGVGYLEAAEPPQPGDAIQIEIRSQLMDARVVKRPFYQPSSQ